ncbi:hypothetical protein D7M10_26405 [Pseudomonas fluorescens]|nr:hypothetical protein D7M10_26405 [Pseudomonas fluorescens]
MQSDRPVARQPPPQGRDPGQCAFISRHGCTRSNVGAGLSAIASPRYIRYTQVMPSQTSQLPQGFATVRRKVYPCTRPSRS